MSSALARRYYKDPDSVKDYVWGWSLRLAEGESIVAATVTVVDPIDSAPVLGDVEFDDTTVTAWLSGGTVSTTNHPITCHITTDQGREDDDTIYLRIEDR